MAVMVRAPNIDGPVKAPGLELVHMIGNVRREIGGDSIVPHKNLVLLQPHLFTVEPNRPILFIGIAVLL